MDKHTFREEEIWEMIRQSAEDVEIPESLRPEHILKQIEAQETKTKKKNWKKICIRMVEMAAALTVTFVAGYQTRELNLQNDVGNVEEVSIPETVPEGFITVENSTELYEKLWAYEKLNEVTDMLGFGSFKYDTMMVEESVMMDAAMVTSSNSDAGGGTADFSQTNLRELGVDEGDIVKTDGEYIYIIKNRSHVQIVKADGDKLEKAAAIYPAQMNESVEDMYVDGEHLILITSGSESKMTESENDIYMVDEYDYVKAITYDISDPAQPKEAGNVEQEGYYRSSRKVGDYVYLFSMYHPRLGNAEEDSEIMPLINDAEMSASGIYMPEYMVNTKYLVMSSVNVKNPSVTVDSKAMVSGADDFYVSSSNIYIYNEEWENSRTTTHILKFHYENGSITGIAAEKIYGYLNDSFSIDEYDGNLRLVTTDWVDGEDKNTLYVLDETLQMTGKIDDIAPGETIRSARFMGDTGYFVTFRQTDPLFSVDLSDPANPVILGELKISGFSSYLHFYGDDQLLGIGYEADPDTGITTGVKLSMFDISDPSNVTEKKKYVIKDASYLPLDQDYKAVLVEPEKNLIGFVCDGNYLVFSYDEECGFESRMVYALESGEDTYWYDNSGYRGLYINEYFYLAEEREVLAFDMDKFKAAAKLELN